MRVLVPNHAVAEVREAVADFNLKGQVGQFVAGGAFWLVGVTYRELVALKLRLEAHDWIPKC